MNYPVQSLWIGNRLSAMEQLSIRSFLANGHEHHLYAYGPLSGVPDGCVLRDANEILPRERVFRDPDIGSFCGVSDLFRYKLLLERGGWWMDLDVICLQPLPIPEEYVFALETANALGSCVFYSEPGAEAMRYLWDIAREKDPAKLVWCEIGPPLLQHAVNRFDLNRFVMGPEAFCPVPCARWYDTFVPGRRREFGKETFAVHLWHEMWRRARLDEDEVYGPRSLYEHLKVRYGLAA